MESFEITDFRQEICDEDVEAALKEAKLSCNFTAADLKKVYVYACRHAQTRVTSKMFVRDAMAQDVFSVNKFDDINLAVKILAGKNISGLPVVDRENRVVGMISEADIVSMVSVARKHTFMDCMRHFLGHPLPEKKMGNLVGDIMSSPAVTTNSDVEVSEAVRLMDQFRIRRLPVVDKNQKLVGLISRSDIIKAMGKKLSVE